MGMPKHVKVGPFQWLHKKVNKKVTKCYGETEHAKLEIRVYGSHPLVERETSVHENLHAAFWVSGASAALGEKREEEVISMLSPVLFAMIRENPELIEWWQEDENL